MHYYLYQITNNANGKIYVGVHKTTDINDGYMGSGKVIRYAIAKHGIENFTKDILEFFENAELMYAREKEVVTDEFLLREDTYNLRRGGTGGFDYIRKSPQYKEWVSRGGHANRDTRTPKRTRALKLQAKRNQALIQNKIKENGGIWWEPARSFLGKRHTIATKELMSNVKRGTNTGKANSQYGTMWITNGVHNQKIKADSTIPTGWYKARK
jgi:hypothetical protein